MVWFVIGLICSLINFTHLESYPEEMDLNFLFGLFCAINGFLGLVWPFFLQCGLWDNTPIYHYFGAFLQFTISLICFSLIISRLVETQRWVEILSLCLIVPATLLTLFCQVYFSIVCPWEMRRLHSDPEHDIENPILFEQNKK